MEFVSSFKYLGGNFSGDGDVTTRHCMLKMLCDGTPALRDINFLLYTNRLSTCAID